MILLTRYYDLCYVFFKQKTAYEMRISDWSSDVCSSDLGTDIAAAHQPHDESAGDQHERHGDDQDEAQESSRHQARPPAMRIRPMLTTPPLPCRSTVPEPAPEPAAARATAP